MLSILWSALLLEWRSRGGSGTAFARTYISHEVCFTSIHYSRVKARHTLDFESYEQCERTLAVGDSGQRCSPLAAALCSRLLFFEPHKHTWLLRSVFTILLASHAIMCIERRGPAAKTLCHQCAHVASCGQGSQAPSPLVTLLIVITDYTLTTFSSP